MAAIAALRDAKLAGRFFHSVARYGQVAGMRTFGKAIQGGGWRPATERTLYPLFSCTKGIVGVAMWALFEERLVRPEERVADIIPEFGTNGKSVVTVEQLLLHTSGSPPEVDDRVAELRLVAEGEPVPGRSPRPAPRRRVRRLVAFRLP